MIHDTQSAQISHKQDGSNIYAIIKTIYPPGYSHNGIVVTHAFGHMMYGYTLLVPMNQRVLIKLYITSFKKRIAENIVEENLRIRRK